ncbi:30S ribosomal protein S1 [Haematococcus lacustris]|uniref:30S ribosomal protein S1 n=1 Tax=Haematococcus lacustris TaxID=44745 RepID=A0A699ZVL7_HAELA|nr:30S ribosomal protein S1 [Haematococcus lacustris]
MLCNRVSNAQLPQRRVVVSAPFLRPLTCHAAAEATPEAATTSVKIDDLCSGKVTKISPSMAFVTLDNNVKGRLHVSMISKERVEAVGDVFSVGDELKVDMALACRQATCSSARRRQYVVGLIGNGAGTSAGPDEDRQAGETGRMTKSAQLSLRWGDGDRPPRCECHSHASLDGKRKDMGSTRKRVRDGMPGKRSDVDVWSWLGCMLEAVHGPACSGCFRKCR